jgi:hypothetical protein
MVEYDDIMYPSAIPFVLVHLACIAAFWTGVTYQAIAICLVLYWVRIFAIGAGYHRYFSHRAYKTSRAFQFVLAFLSQSSAQKSVLWWAAMHRHHHLHSDTELDILSPRHKGFIYSHVGWIFARSNDRFDLNKNRRLRVLSRIEVAAPVRVGAAASARFVLLRDRRLARPGSGVLLEHGTGLSCDVLHQFTRPRLRPQTLPNR